MSKGTRTPEQRRLLETLDGALKHWYELKRSDISEVLYKMGISSKYSMKVVGASNSSVSLKISSCGEVYDLSINRGDMTNPYPSWCLSKDGKKTYYSVNKNFRIVEVEEICSFNEKGEMMS